VALISFVIPAFNQARYVRQAIESALAQTHTPVEVIVVDDGSTDGTARALAEYRERSNVTIIRQPNAGVAAARNRGLAGSRGEFVCFLDADDYVAPTFAATLSVALIDDASVGFAYSDVTRVDQFEAPVDDYSVGAARRTVNGDIFESLVIGGYFTPNCALVRRSVLDAVGHFDLDLGGHADYDLWLRITGAGHAAVHISERLAFYRMHGQSMSHDTDQMRDTRIRTLDKAARQMPARLAPALAQLQDVAADFHVANTWLNGQWNHALRALEAERRAPASLDSVRTAVVFGSGDHGHHAIRLARTCGWTVAWIVDNNPGMWDQTAHDLPVRSPASLTSGGFDVVIVASLAGKAAIAKQLTDLGLSAGRQFVHFLDPVRVGGLTHQVSLA